MCVWGIWLVSAASPLPESLWRRRREYTGWIVGCGVVDLREGEARVGERIEAFVDDGLVPLELEEHPQDRSGDATTGDDDLGSSHIQGSVQ